MVRKISGSTRIGELSDDSPIVSNDEEFFSKAYWYCDLIIFLVISTICYNMIDKKLGLRILNS